MSCFICKVSIYANFIELTDSGHRSFFIDTSDNSVMLEFKSWFKDVYKACIPQTLTVVQYDIENNNGEPTMKVVKLIYKKNENSVTMLNETKENSVTMLNETKENFVTMLNETKENAQ